jgi:hypothetical protein
MDAVDTAPKHTRKILADYLFGVPWDDGIDAGLGEMGSMAV